MRTISLPVGRSWWRSHQELGTPYCVHTDPPRKELWHLGRSLPSWCLNQSQGSSALQRLVIHTIPCLGYTAHTVRASEQPCRGCLCISSCYPQSKVSLRFLLLKQHIISLQISLQYSPLFTCLEISLPQELRRGNCCFWCHSQPLAHCSCPHLISTLSHVLFKPWSDLQSFTPFHLEDVGSSHSPRRQRFQRHTILAEPIV